MLLFQISNFLARFLFQGNPIVKPRDKRASKPRKVVKGRKTPIAGPAKGKMKPKGKKTKKKIISFHMTLCWLCNLESFHMNLCWLCTLECLLHLHCLCYITWAWPTVQSVLCTWHLFFSFLITCCPNLPLPAILSQLMSTPFEPYFVFQTVYSEQPYVFLNNENATVDLDQSLFEESEEEVDLLCQWRKTLGTVKMSCFYLILDRVHS